MPNIYNFLLFLHVSVGAASLLLFWLPIVTTKGSFLHRRSGRWYANSMYIVSVSAFVVALMVLIDPIGTKYAGSNFSTSEALQLGNQERLFSVFLLSISVLVFSSVRHGLLTLRAKRDHVLMRAWSHIALNSVLVGLGLVLAFMAYAVSQILFLVFAAICIATGAGNLRYCMRQNVERVDWLISHMGAMIGAGIGSYTAFFVFGGSEFFSRFLSGNWELIPWTLPGVVGTAFTIILARKYRNQYSTQERLRLLDRHQH